MTEIEKQVSPEMKTQDAMKEDVIMTQEYTKQPLEVEPAKAGDAEAISELLRTTWMNTYPNTEAGITEEDIRLRTEGENGKVVGMAAPGYIDGKRRIGAMYVLPELQGKGVGSKLMEKALEWHGNDKEIYLNVASYNQNAINFYKRFGFEETNTPIIDEGNVYGDTRIPEIEMVLRAEQ